MVSEFDKSLLQHMRVEGFDRGMGDQTVEFEFKKGCGSAPVREKPVVQIKQSVQLSSTMEIEAREEFKAKEFQELADELSYRVSQNFEDSMIEAAGGPKTINTIAVVVGVNGE